MRYLLAAFLLILAPARTRAQVVGGEVHGRIADEYDRGLPDVAVRLTGDALEAEDVSGAGGRFLFRAVPPGRYRIEASGPRLASVRALDIDVHAGMSVDLTVVMKSVAREETVTVFAGLSAVDRRSLSVADVSTRDEREAVPRPLDAWSALAFAPGLVATDVGGFGADGASPPIIQSRGSRPIDTVWYVDGVDLRPPSVAGIAPRHASLVDEIAVSTAGHDLRHATGGAAVNVVTRRAGDRWNGSARGSIGLGSDEPGADRVDDANDF
jgi:hypothetical protein